MHKRNRAKQLRKRQSVEDALNSVEPLYQHLINPHTRCRSATFSGLTEVIASDDSLISDSEVEVGAYLDWDTIPPSLDPSHGELDEVRSKR